MIPLPMAVSTAELAGGLGFAALAGVLYLRRARTLASEGIPLPRWRQACFYSGLATIAVSLVALGHLASISLSWHVAQQLIIGEIASLLLVLGLTGALLAPVMRIRVFERLRVLANPLVAFPLWALNLYLWHLPALYQGALEHSGVQAIEHICFLAVGINMWMCLLGPLPVPRWFGNLGKLVYIVTVRLAAAVLANIFLWSGTVFYPFYTHPDSIRHTSPLVDQNIAGAIMLVAGSLITLGLFYWLFTRTLEGSDGRERQLERGRRARVGFADAAGPATAAGRRAAYRPSAARHSRQDRELGPVTDGSVGPL
jgi:cytochrome c oxidase assembly factor CtaG